MTTPTARTPTGRTPASYYVQRTRAGRVAWTGSIRSEARALKERAAWVEAGWTAEVIPNTPEIRQQVRAWERSIREAGR